MRENRANAPTLLNLDSLVRFFFVRKQVESAYFILIKMWERKIFVRSKPDRDCVESE